MFNACGTTQQFKVIFVHPLGAWPCASLLTTDNSVYSIWPPGELNSTALQQCPMIIKDTSYLMYSNFLCAQGDVAQSPAAFWSGLLMINGQRGVCSVSDLEVMWWSYQVCHTISHPGVRLESRNGSLAETGTRTRTRIMIETMADTEDSISH